MRGIRLHETPFSRKLRQSQTSAEQRLWAKLRGRRLGGYKFVRQQPIGPDGATHSTAEELARDARRSIFLCDAGFRVMRVTNEDVFANIDGVCETILAMISRQREKP